MSTLPNFAKRKLDIINGKIKPETIPPFKLRNYTLEELPELKKAFIELMEVKRKK